MMASHLYTLDMTYFPQVCVATFDKVHRKFTHISKQQDSPANRMPQYGMRCRQRAAIQV